MPKLGMEPIRRAALVKATIAAVGEAGHLDVTVGGIARRAGMSPALAHHYFGSKDEIFLAAMRHILSLYGAEVRDRLKAARSPRERLEAIIRGSFAPENFAAETVTAWLVFYVRALGDPGARRLLAVYHRRLRSNLLHALRPLAGERAAALADDLGALVDGCYLRAALGGAPDGAAEAARVLRALDGAFGPGR